MWLFAFEATPPSATDARHHMRGINLQLVVDRIEPLLIALDAAEWPLQEQPNEAWYRVGDPENGQREFLVQDPDGYLLRFVERLGVRAPS
jgi:hypothetical protein